MNPAPQEALPASQYLQDRLQERRARNTRPKRSRQTDFGPRRAADDDIFLDEAEHSRHAAARLYDSSPLTTGSRLGSDAGGNGYNKRRSVGVKDMDGQMDRLTKQNFALKLELDHRREHTLKIQEQLDAMKAQVKRAERLEEEHAELLRINSQLVDELEKRDKAVEEAMDIICDLEEKVVDIEERHSNTRPSTANADSGYAGTETHEQAPASSPPDLSRIPKTPRATRQPPPSASAAAQKLHSVVNGQTPARIRREPSVLSQKKPSTHALRSVYLETAQNLHPVKSFNSLLSKRDSRIDEENEVFLHSPRLSVLSESSFPSLYSPKKQSSPERYAWEAPEADESLESPQAHFRQDSINRVSRWITDSDVVEETPSKSNRISSPLSQHTERGMSSPTLPSPSEQAHFQSLNDALSTASTAAAVPHELLQPVSYSKPYATKAEKQRARQVQQPRPISIVRGIKGEPLLPPTPDSASTRMLRASRSSIAGERSLLDVTPAAVKGYDALEPVRTAPKQMRSSIELTTAYHNNLNYRDGAYGNQQDDSSSDEDDVDERPEMIKDLSVDYDDFPDGNSILMGTPSRFLKHGKRTANEQPFFDGSNISPPDTARSPPRRRLSSSEATVSPRKPSLGRAETSPTFLGTLGRIVTSGSKSTVDTVTSPRSYHSGSSGNRTIVQNETDGNVAFSPTDTSPARARTTFGQRTQKLFRRMSNSHPERSEPREMSPLPTLTSTPSSAYINAVHKDSRRPSTSEAEHTPAAGVTPQHIRAPGSREGRRPSLQARTQTEPANARPASVAAVERMNPFKRSGSVKHGAADTPSPQQLGTVEKEGAAGRGGVTRRRGSIREAVGAGRRPWR